MKIVMLVGIPAYAKAVIERFREVPDAELITVEDADQLESAIADAHALILNARGYSERVAQLLRTKGKSVRWIHTTSAGNEPLITLGTPRHVTVTRSGGHSAPIVAEHAIALLLALARNIPYSLENQRKRLWILRRGGPRVGTMRSLFGRTAVVLGFGPIGQEIARRLKVLGMTVISVTRSGTPHELADESYGREDLRLALSKATVLVVAAPSSPETHRMIGAGELAALQPDGFVVNVGRGTIIDTAAIEAALRNGTILGAGLDVQDPEPLPADHSLWSAPNLIITPHCAGGGDPLSAERQADSVLRNFKRLRCGETLEHVLETRLWD
jgi:phosphoglycerate dehydrogenase-like enzyme